MSENIVITVLVENSVQGRGLMGEHGLAFHIQVGEASMLFDTGQTEVLCQNALSMEVDLTGLRAIALSHGHYDHTGGLRAVWERAPKAELYTHPAAMVRHFARNVDGTTRNIGISEEGRKAVEAHAGKVRSTATPTEVLRGVYLTGEIPRTTDYEDVGGPFVLDAAGFQPDRIADDQALFFDTSYGVVVVLGCAHAGVINTLRHIKALTFGRPIHAVLGGMHLLSASPERLTRTVEALRELKIQRLGPAHCTGAPATARLWTEFPHDCVVCATGCRFEFGR